MRFNCAILSAVLVISACGNDKENGPSEPKWIEIQELGDISGIWHLSEKDMVGTNWQKIIYLPETSKDLATIQIYMDDILYAEGLLDFTLFQNEDAQRKLNLRTSQVLFDKSKSDGEKLTNYIYEESDEEWKILSVSESNLEISFQMSGLVFASYFGFFETRDIRHDTHAFSRFNQELPIERSCSFPIQDEICQHEIAEQYYCDQETYDEVIGDNNLNVGDWVAIEAEDQMKRCRLVSNDYLKLNI